MTMYLTRQPMTKGQLDGQLAQAGWRRDGNEAHDRYNPASFIHDIDKVPCADGRMRIMIEAKAHGAHELAATLGCISEEEPEFWQTLGIEIEPETVH